MKACFCLLTCALFNSVLIAQDGNIGIGNFNPTKAKFEVSGAVGTTVAIFGGDGQGISVQRGFPAIGFNHYYDGVSNRYIANGYAGVQWLNSASGQMFFDIFNAGLANAVVGSYTRAMIIDSRGRVGIGAFPQTTAKLTIARGTGFDGTAVFRGTSYASYFNYGPAENTYIRGGKQNSYVYLNNIGGGDVLIGSSTNHVLVGINSGNPMYACEIKQVSGRGVVIVNSSSFHNWSFNVGASVSGLGSYHRLYYDEGTNPIGVFHPITGQYSGLSDERVKENVTALGNASELIEQLRPVRYEMKVGGGPRLGFIAQEVKNVIPELVHVSKGAMPGEEHGDIHALNYDGMAVYAIQTIKEQQELIEMLRKKINLLKQNHSSTSINTQK